MQQTGTNRRLAQRLRKGLTLRELADECTASGAPVGFGQLGKIERGEAIPNPQLRAVLAELLELDINDFERKVG